MFPAVNPNLKPLLSILHSKEITVKWLLNGVFQNSMDGLQKISWAWYPCCPVLQLLLKTDFFSGYLFTRSPGLKVRRGLGSIVQLLTSGELQSPGYSSLVSMVGISVTKLKPARSYPAGKRTTLSVHDQAHHHWCIFLSLAKWEEAYTKMLYW